MRTDNLNNKILDEIRKKIPSNSKLVNSLSNMLFIEKEAVYRRLRGEVPFTFQEAIVISKELSISLDNISDSKDKKCKPFQLKLAEYINPKESDLTILDEYIDFLINLKNNNENSELGSVCNTLPRSLYSKFKYLTKYYIFKWNYHYSTDTNQKYFHNIEISSQMDKFNLENFIESKNFSTTYFILDYYIFKYLVNDIKYFKSINLIREEDVIKIKEDIQNFIDYIESLTISGKYKETDNKVYFYISDINFDTCYSYIQTSDLKLSFVNTFLLDAVSSQDETVFEKTKSWFRSLLKVSSMISVTGERQRTLFFENQRILIDNL